MPHSAAALYALTNALQPVRRAWQQAAVVALADSGLSVSLATAVLLVHRLGDGVQQKVLAEEIGVNPGAMVRTLDQAEAATLLQRREIPGNRRVRAVHILPEGRRLAVKMEQALADMRAAVLGDIPAQDIETTTRVLRQFEERAYEHLKQSWAKLP
ncbi:MarR family winged helix-turn-helix transcriptional regulator [Pseudomonas capeferrum]|uniref:MarR family winged helix-turn-helix transcriptional regulator n=1 Tax=Pseudomonas capeferrum TaxID=1495066 RepID=UPI0015E2AE70|nr:MarR family winged helix-turn-helix transcriptional regulator [Pseudomonas capeferrum]